MIRNLADQFPKLRKELLTIHDNIVEFPDDPELSYDNLGLIHNGGEAMNTYATLMELPEEERLVIRQSLLEYCKLDTLAMVKIWEKLNNKRY